MSLSKVLEVARGELGCTENPPGSNWTKYGAWIGLDRQPWCMSFLAWCFHQAGDFKAFMGGGKTGSCGILYRWYKAQGQTVPVEDVRAGDIVILNFHGTQDTQHCGLVESVGRLNEEPTFIRTIEGNTTPGDEGSQYNGGCVARKLRHPANIVGVCRPNYTEEAEQVDDIKGHWAEDAIRWCMEHGIMTGYEDGTFAPDKPVTRAELAVVARRIMEAWHV